MADGVHVYPVYSVGNMGKIIFLTCLCCSVGRQTSPTAEGETE